MISRKNLDNRSNEIMLIDVLRFFIRQRNVVLISFCVMSVAVCWYNFSRQPVYESKVSVIIGGSGSLDQRNSQFQVLESVDEISYRYKSVIKSNKVAFNIIPIKNTRIIEVIVTSEELDLAESSVKDFLNQLIKRHTLLVENRRKNFEKSLTRFMSNNEKNIQLIDALIAEDNLFITQQISEITTSQVSLSNTYKDVFVIPLIVAAFLSILFAMFIDYIGRNRYKLTNA